MHNGPLRVQGEPIYPKQISKTLLHEAASVGDLKKIEHILSAGSIDPSCRDPKHGNTALHEAAWRGYSQCVKRLCQPPPVPIISINKTKGTNKLKTHHLHSIVLNLPNEGGFSALHLAAQNGHNQSCREILLAGGDPNVQNNYGDTPIHTACRYGHAGATRILLSAKADLSRVNLNGDTALHIACAMGRRKLTRILLSAGSSLKIKNGQNEVARDIAVRKKLPEILEILDTPVPPPQKQSTSAGGGGGGDGSSHNKKNKSNERDIQSSNSSNKQNKQKGKKSPSTKKSITTAIDPKLAEVNAKNWSPYGCHYFPDPRSFPSPKLETLPKEPLGTGEQYYLDLAGNIRKGPIGVGNTCYCGPFFRHIEERMSRNKKCLKKYVNKATEKLDHKVQALAMRTDGQIEQITRKMLADRIRCDGQRMHLEQWLKRGDRARTTVTPQTSKSRKDQANTNTLTRCRSLELLDNNTSSTAALFLENFPIGESGCGANGLSRSVEILDNNIISEMECNSKERVITNKKCRPKSLYHNEEFFNNNDVDDEDVKESATIAEFSSHHHCSSSSEKRKSYYLRDDEIDQLDEENSLFLDGGGKIDRSRRYAVAERLKELLSKTNDIIEMERSVRQRSNEAFNRLNSSADHKLKSIHHYHHQRSTAATAINPATNGSHPSSSSILLSGGEDSSFQIAEEMNKITESLLGTKSAISSPPPILPSVGSPLITSKENGLSSHNKYHYSPSSRSAVSSSSNNNQHHHNQLSSKGFSTKEHLKSHEIEQELSSVLSETSLRSDIYLPDSSQILTTPFTSPSSVTNKHLSGFYQNTNFDGDFMENHHNHHQKQQPSITLDSDDRCEISEMANLKQLNDLKSRILNGGGHGRNLIVRRQPGDGASGQDTVMGKCIEQQQQQQQLQQAPPKLANGHLPKSYEIRNGAIKTLKPTTKNSKQENGTADDNNKSDELTTIFPIRNKVLDLVAKIQNSTINSGGILNSINYPIDNDDNDSESSEEDEIDDDDDEDDDDDDVDNDDEDNEDYEDDDNVDNEGNSDANDKNRVDKTTGFDTIDSVRSGQVKNIKTIISNIQQTPTLQQLMGNASTNDISFKNLPQITQPYKSSMAKMLDTRFLIPKDAYFHELPHKSRLKPPIAEPLTTNQTNQTHQTYHNPNMDIITNDIVQPSATTQSIPATTTMTTSTIPSNQNGLFYHQPQAVHHHHYHHQQNNVPTNPSAIVPQREKLLSNRKFGGGSATAQLLGSKDIRSQQFYSVDDVQQKLHLERDSNNDSGYSARVSNEGPSPSLSGSGGQTDIEQQIDTLTSSPIHNPHLQFQQPLIMASPPLRHNYLLANGQQHQQQKQQQQQHQLQQPQHNSNIGTKSTDLQPTKFDQYFVTNIGASSLV